MDGHPPGGHDERQTEMTTNQAKAMRRAVKAADRAAAEAQKAFDEMIAAFPVANGRDRGGVMAAAKMTDHTKADAAAMRRAAEQTGAIV